MPVRCASADAYRKGTDSGLFGETTVLIVEALRKHPDGLTRREIGEETGLEANQVSGRVNGLIHKYKRAGERGRRKCRVSGNIVNVVVLLQHGESVPDNEGESIDHESDYSGDMHELDRAGDSVRGDGSRSGMVGGQREERGGTVVHCGGMGGLCGLASEDMTEVERYAQSIMTQPTREARNSALETVPSHLREKVRAYVINEFAKRKKARK